MITQLREDAQKGTKYGRYGQETCVNEINENKPSWAARDPLINIHGVQTTCKELC